YRRDDSKHQAARIYDALIKVLPSDDVFMDIGSIRPGDDFVETLEGWVAKCDILLALIGAGWLDAADSGGKRRLDDENDLVRIEVREALKRGIPVVPVILDGAKMPERDELPGDLKKLVRRNAEFVEFRTFDTDAGRLIHRLNLANAPKPVQTQPKATPVLSEMRIFRDFPEAPEMAVVPKGYFIMGSPPGEPGRSKDEGPRHEVIIPQAFAIGRFAVTKGEFSAFVADTNYKAKGGAYVWIGKEWALNSKNSWQNPGFDQDDSHPVVCVNSHDVQAYIDWLNSKVPGRPYRLPSEAEWEYACRAGTATPFWWGSSIATEQANYNGNFIYEGGGAKGVHRQKTVPVQSFEPNPWGSWESDPARLRGAFRGRGSLKNRYSDRGFRVVRTLTP
ncbi:MAG: SUMF1/EgtB/PvdO family nonheme iron enzyme, partial [Rhodomicrobium sp.]|nr:SUMF1/EgtB/PvdO family nonheme iron enzyme [Rhodomicrobium sp.]